MVKARTEWTVVLTRTDGTTATSTFGDELDARRWFEAMQQQPRIAEARLLKLRIETCIAAEELWTAPKVPA